MFATKSKGDHTAAQAWDYLSSAMTSAGESARDAGKASQKLAGRASRTSRRLADRAGGTADEAWARANAAAAALAGRKPRRPWGLVAAIGLVGIALGWAAASSARAALERQAENDELEVAETAVVITPTDT